MEIEMPVRKNEMDCSCSDNVSDKIGDLRVLNDKALLERTKLWAERERRDTLVVLHHLAEVERRRLYTKLNYASLWEYCLKELRYSESAAHRRITSMRLLREMPEIQTKVNRGDLTLSTLAKAATFFKQEAKLGEPLAKERKTQVLNCLEGKSARQAERELLNFSSCAEQVGRESTRALPGNLTELCFVVDAKLIQDLEQLKGLFAHRYPNLNMAELVRILAQLALEKLDPARQKSRARHPAGVATAEQVSPVRPLPTSEVNGATPAPGRAPTTAQRRTVFLRDQGRCTWRNPKTGVRCNSRHRLEVDHCQPFAWGGKTEVENLRLLCREHNALQAIKCFGMKRISSRIRPPIPPQ